MAKIGKIKTKTQKHEYPHSLAVVRKYFPKVNYVEEAREPLVIEVTNQDSNSASVRNHESCAMAIACKRKANADGVIVSIKTAYVIRGDTATRYEVPQAVQREIVSFDRNAGFAPGTYKLTPYAPSNRLGVAQNRGKNGRSKGRKFIHYTANIRTVLGSDIVR